MSERAQNPLREGMRLKRTPQPNTLIILGATGDLTHRKLMPSLFSLHQQGFLPPDFHIVGFARREKSTDQFRHEMQEALKSQLDDSKDSDEIERFFSYLHYHQGDFTNIEPYNDLKAYLDKSEKDRGIPANRLFYLATPPSAYDDIVNNLGKSGLNKGKDGWTRIIIEKPFGHDLDSAIELNDRVSEVFKEDQVYRIDHYLGKETVQNILVFRFANSIFEPIWNRRYVEHVQITVAENLGVEGRGNFFEETGIIRDIVQNHLLQLLCLCAMEPPSEFDSNAVRDEKVKVLKAVEKYDPGEVDNYVVRGQYAAGSLMGKSLEGYREEDGVAKDSNRDTFMALKVFIDNWRWASVPFYLRAGKRLPKKVTEIAIQFKGAPMQMFEQSDTVGPNTLTLRIQPDEGISMRFDSKVPGMTSHFRPVTMDFRYGTSFGKKTPDAYERLLLDAMIGDSTLFTRADENQMAWRFLEPIFQHWEAQKDSIPMYKIGTWGPDEANELLSRDGREWRRL